MQARIAELSWLALMQKEDRWIEEGDLWPQPDEEEEEKDGNAQQLQCRLTIRSREINK